MIALSKIGKQYNNSGANKLDVLKDVDLNIEKGEFVVITGKSGSGKSTLLNIISGIDKPSGGNIRVAKEDIQVLNEDQLSKWRGRHMGIIFQFFQLIPTLSVLENVVLPMDMVGVIPKEKRIARAKMLLQKVDMYAHRHKTPGELSGGEQQRIAIARALANDAELIVADEPTGNLDSFNTKEILNLLGVLNEQGKTIVMVTHEKDEIHGSTRNVVMKDGEIIRDERRNAWGN